MGLPLLSITRKQGIITHKEAGRKDSSSNDKSKYKRICTGDIGYNTMRMWQGVSALSRKEGIVSPAYTIIVAKIGISAEFMSYLFKLPRTVHNFYRYSQGLVSDTWNLKFSNFSKVTVSIPSYEEQIKIAQTLRSLDKRIELLGMMNDQLIDEKKSLMQQLLTGRRRIKVEDETPTEVA